MSVYITLISEAAEYCLRETFEAHCSDNEVIMMTQAKFGRMKIGRCVAEDMGIEHYLHKFTIHKYNIHAIYDVSLYFRLFGLLS